MGLLKTSMALCGLVPGMDFAGMTGTPLRLTSTIQKTKEV
jgi:hypothetical protein